MIPYYQDEAVTIYHGDALEILPRLCDGTASVGITDPPYGVGFGYGDSYVDDEHKHLALVLPALQELRRIAPVVLVTPGLRNLWMYPKPTWTLCWAKPGSPRRSDLGGFNEWEPVLMYGKRIIYNDFIKLPAWNNTSPDAENHPCPKPIRLMRWLVTQASDPGEVILDPFAGSGSTLRAAKDLGRKAIGIEIEERYCEIAVRRLGQEVLALEEVA